MAWNVNLQASLTRSPSRRSSACSRLSFGSCGSCASAAPDAKQSITTNQRMTASGNLALAFFLFPLGTGSRPPLRRFISNGRNLNDALPLRRFPHPLRGCVVVRGMNRLCNRTDVARRLAFGLNGVTEDSALVLRRQTLLRFPQMLHLRQQQRRYRAVRVSHAPGTRNNDRLNKDRLHLSTPLSVQLLILKSGQSSRIASSESRLFARFPSPLFGSIKTAALASRSETCG